MEDLKLIVEGRSIHVNKATLALLSPVFEKMFTANFRERDCEELELPDKTYDSFIEFLDCVYPGHHKTVTGKMGVFVCVCFFFFFFFVLFKVFFFQFFYFSLYKHQLYKYMEK